MQLLTLIRGRFEQALTGWIENPAESAQRVSLSREPLHPHHIRLHQRTERFTRNRRFDMHIVVGIDNGPQLQPAPIASHRKHTTIECRLRF